MLFQAMQYLEKEFFLEGLMIPALRIEKDTPTYTNGLGRILSELPTMLQRGDMVYPVTRPCRMIFPSQQSGDAVVVFVVFHNTGEGFACFVNAADLRLPASRGHLRLVA
jgi:hypothetical protein